MTRRALLVFETGARWSQPTPDGAGRAIQISLLDSRERPLMPAIASSTVSLPVTGNRTTLSPKPAPSVIT